MSAVSAYIWSKEFLEGQEAARTGDAGPQATLGEVKGLRQEMHGVKEPAAKLSLENKLLNNLIASEA